MNVARQLSLLLALLLVGFVPAAGQQPAAAPDRAALIDAYVAQEMARYAIPGLSVVIAKDNRIVYEKGFGFADLENKVPFTPQTVSRIGSVSKTFTATAVLQLVERGKIDLDAEVQTYLPTFPKKPWPITVRELLCHQGGIRHYTNDNEMLSAVHYDTVEAAMAVFKDDPLVGEPATKYSYSTYGYTVLSRIVEVASGESFGDYVRRHIVEPLKLGQTGLDENRRIVEHRARWYTKSETGPVENAPAVDLSNKWGGGGMISTVEDLVAYAAAFDSDRLLKRETIKRMFTAQTTRDGKATTYGLGWGVGADDGGRRRIMHSGGSVGATALLAKFPDQGITVAVLVNCEYQSASRIGLQIASIYFDGKPRPEEQRD